MNERDRPVRAPRRRLRLLALAAAVLVIVAIALLIITAPDPTVLRVRVIDASTGSPLSGARVRIQSSGAQPLPVMATDDRGVALFRYIPPSSTYTARVQQMDYELAIRPQIAVPEGKTTALDVPLAPQADGRLYVGLDGARVAEIDTASLLPVATERLDSIKSGAVQSVRVNPGRDLLYTLTGSGPELPSSAITPTLAYDEIDVLDRRTKDVLARREVDGSVLSLELTSDGSRVLALDLPRGAELPVLEQMEMLTLDPRSAEVLTRTQLGTLDLSAFASHARVVLLPGALPADVEPYIPRLAAQLLPHPDGRHVYVLFSNEARLWMLDLAGREKPQAILLQARPMGAALSTDSRYLYVWAADPGFVERFPFPVWSTLLSAVSADGSCPSTLITGTLPISYTFMARAATLLADNQGLVTRRDLCVYYDPEHQQPPLGAPAEDRLITIRTDQEVTLERQPIPMGNTAMAISASRSELYLLNGTLGTLSILPLAGGAPTVIAVGSDPGALAVSADGRWVYVANRQSRSISAVYLPAAAVVHTIPLDGVPYSLAVYP